MLSLLEPLSAGLTVVERLMTNFHGASLASWSSSWFANSSEEIFAELYEVWTELRDFGDICSQISSVITFLSHSPSILMSHLPFLYVR